MIEQLVTQAGHRLGIGRIHRREIDRFAAEHPAPEPPERSAAELGIEVFGGIEEEEFLLDWKDPEYLEADRLFDLSFWHSRLEHIAPAVGLLTDLTVTDQEEISTLEELGEIMDHAGILRFVIIKSEFDAAQVVMAVLYNSTVTMQGIQEAGDRYGVRWKGKVVTTDVPSSPLWTGREFSDRRTAKYCGYNWDSFCELTGPEQSALAAFHRLDVRINNIFAKM